MMRSHKIHKANYSDFKLKYHKRFPVKWPHCTYTTISLKENNNKYFLHDFTVTEKHNAILLERQNAKNTCMWIHVPQNNLCLVVDRTIYEAQNECFHLQTTPLRAP